MERLNSLLSKSVAYSEFLANKIKKEGEEGTVNVADGAVQGTGLRQPKLIKGQMRPYQLIGVHWLVGLYENGLNGILGDEMVRARPARRSAGAWRAAARARARE